MPEPDQDGDYQEKDLNDQADGDAGGIILFFWGLVCHIVAFSAILILQDLPWCRKE